MKWTGKSPVCKSKSLVEVCKHTSEEPGSAAPVVRLVCRSGDPHVTLWWSISAPQCSTVPGLCVLGCVHKWLTLGARGNGCVDFVINWNLDHRGQLFGWREAFWVKRTIRTMTSENGVSLQWKEPTNDTCNLSIYKVSAAVFRITSHWVVKRQFFFYWYRFHCKLAISMGTVPLIAHKCMSVLRGGPGLSRIWWERPSASDLGHPVWQSLGNGCRRLRVPRHPNFSLNSLKPACSQFSRVSFLFISRREKRLIK